MNDVMEAEYGFDTPGRPTLVVALRDGRVSITTGEGAATTVHVRGPRADEARVEQRGERIVVVGPKPHGMFASTALDYEIRCPADTELVVKSGNAGVDVTGCLRSARVKSGSGAVTLGDVSGPCTVDTGFAPIGIGRADDALRVRSGSGSVKVASARQVVVSTGNGDVAIGELDGKLVAKTGRGSLEVGEAQGDIAFTTGFGDTVVRSCRGGRIATKGGRGSIRIGVADGVAVWTDISTGSGTIRSDLPSRGKPEPGAPYVEIRATTGAGDVELSPA